MARFHIPDPRGRRTRRRDIFVSIARNATVVLWTIWSSASVAVPTERVPREPYGTAELQQCVANMQASLGARSILGSRDTAGYIQDLGNLESMGQTEYGVMVGRCQERLFHRYQRSLGKK